MKEYFIGIISTVFAGGMILSILPSGSEKKYLRLLCGLAVIGCIIFPLLSFFKNWEFDKSEWEKAFSAEGFENSEYVEIYNDSLKKAGVKNAANTLKSEIIKEFSADDDNVDVKIYVEEKSGEFYISSAILEIHPSGLILDPHEIKKYIEYRLDCECSVVYD